MADVKRITNEREAIESVIEGICYLIYSEANSVASEQTSPSLSADSSDSRIQDGKKTVERLRAIREEFENLMTGIIL